MFHNSYYYYRIGGQIRLWQGYCTLCPMTTFQNPDIFAARPKTKNLGIWMDHSNAHLMEFTTDPITTDIISNEFTHREKQHSLGKSEDGMHHKEQQQQSEYYKKLGDIIRKFEDVLLFGPTDAKVELLNILRADQQFKHIHLETKDTDKMTQNEQHAFVKDYFAHH
jgi:hypothetical protein